MNYPGKSYSYPSLLFILHIFCLTGFVLIVFGPVSALILQVIKFLFTGGLSPIISWRRFSLLINSLWFSVSVSGVSMTLGVLASLLLCAWRKGMASRMKWLFLVLVPVPPYVHALVWTSAIEWITGLSLQGWTGTFLVEVMAYLPLATGLSLTGLETIDPLLIESALMIKPDFTVFRKIILPLLSPFLMACLCFLTLFSLMDYTVPSLFSVNIYSLEIFAEYSAANYPSTAFLMSVPLLVVSIVIVIFFHFILKKLFHSSRYLKNLSLFFVWPGWFLILQIFALFILIVQVIVPVFILSYSGGWNIISTVKDGWNEILYTFRICLLSSILSLPFAFSTAGELNRGSNVWWFLVLLPLAIPPSLTGIGLISIWNYPGSFYGTSLMPVLASMSRFTPLASIVLLIQWKRIDPLLIDAARILEGDFIKLWFRIILPMVMPGLAGAFFLVFALTAGELGATLLVVPPGCSTLTMKIYNYMHYGASDSVAGLCLIMAGISVAAGIFLLIASGGRRSFLPESRGKKE